MSRFRDRFFLNFYCLKQSVFKEKELSCVLQNNAKDINIEGKSLLFTNKLWSHILRQNLFMYTCYCVIPYTL